MRHSAISRSDSARESLKERVGMEEVLREILQKTKIYRGENGKGVKKYILDCARCDFEERGMTTIEKGMM